MRDPDRIYLEGNSLGMPARSVRAAIEAGLATWADELVGGWEAWIDLPRQVGDRLAERIAAKGRALTTLAIELADAWLATLGFEVATARDENARGARVSLRHPKGSPIARALIERANVIPDFRRPDILRLGFSPLTTRFVDIWNGLDRIRDIVARGEQRGIDPAGHRVT